MLHVYKYLETIGWLLIFNRMTLDAFLYIEVQELGCDIGDPGRI